MIKKLHSGDTNDIEEIDSVVDVFIDLIIDSFLKSREKKQEI
mgnify:CR=1 FL=1